MTASALTQDCDPQATADLLRALAHPARLAILCRLLGGELSVSGFEAELGLRQPSLSQQLGLLREAGLVTTRREAKSVIYRIADRRLAVLLDALRRYVAGDTNVPVEPAMRPLAVRPTASTRSVTQAPGIESKASECGVFSSAGWGLATDHNGKRRNG